MYRRHAILRWTCTAALAAALSLLACSIAFPICIQLRNSQSNPPTAGLLFLEPGGIHAFWDGDSPRPKIEQWQPVPRRQTSVIMLPYYHDTGVRTRARIPLWIPILLLAPPTLLLWRAHRRARRSPTACPNCNYPLTGLTTNAPCPECGTRGQIGPRP